MTTDVGLLIVTGIMSATILLLSFHIRWIGRRVAALEKMLDETNACP